MKKLLLFLAINFCLTGLHAQAPQGMNYQAVARNASGSILGNQNISIRITIMDMLNGATVYQETHSPTTNQFGLFTINVGKGTVVSGTFAAIPWASITPWMQVEMDPAGGNSYVLMGSSQLLSVPYALNAEKANTTNEWQTNGNNIFNKNTGNTGIGTSAPVAKLDVNGTALVKDSIGIGTTLPTAKLDVRGNARITDGTQGNGKVLTSDANGNAYWNGVIACAASDAGFYTANDSVAAGEIKTIVFKTELYDVGGNNYDPATGIFTAPVAGIYHCDAVVMLDRLTGNSNGSLHFEIVKNNSSYFWGAFTPVNDYVDFTYGADINLAAGDNIKFVVRNLFTDTFLLHVTNEETRMNIHLVK